MRFFILRKKTIILCCVLALLLFCSILAIPTSIFVTSSVSENSFSPSQSAAPEKKFIKWVDFNIPYEALETALETDIKSHGEATEYHWIELLAYLGAKYGGNWKQYRRDDFIKLTKSLANGSKLEELTADMKYYPYYLEAYGAVLNGFVGEYETEMPDADNPEQTKYVKQYGLKVFSPIARGYAFSHYDDFGNSRSYGYKRKHLGHDLMGSIGTPIIAIESGIAECVGWNQYGGWRIGIRSLDSKRYYYYAHLRKNHPYNDMYEGKIIKAGDVIGYLGMTGYSTKENVNNINTPHLHYGIQLIFDESQKEGNGEIWIDCYAITKLLQKHTSAVYKDAETKEYYRSYDFTEESIEKLLESSKDCN